MYCITSHISDRPRDCCTLSQRQNGYSVVPEHPHVGPHGPNRASFLMNPMYSIARTRQCPRKSCSPRQPMAAYMWNGIQPFTSFTLIPNPDPNPNPNHLGLFSTLRHPCPHPNPNPNTSTYTKSKNTSTTIQHDFFNYFSSGIDGGVENRPVVDNVLRPNPEACHIRYLPPYTY